MEINRLSRNLGIMHGVEDGSYYPGGVSLTMMDGGSICSPGQPYATSSGVARHIQGSSGVMQDSVIKIEPVETVSSDSRCSQEQDEGGSSGEASQPGRERGDFVACRVCGDRASGYHYGVTSCEGCKGFFRRSMQKQMEYRCLRDGKCQVVRMNRNRCQSCRFKKCIAAGMSRDSVRYGRVPKRSQSSEDQAVSTTQPMDGHSKADDEIPAILVPAVSAAETQQMAIYDVICSVSHSHTAHCCETEDKIKATARTAVTLLRGPEINNDLLTRSDGLDLCRCIMFKNLAEIITPSINKVVEFAKRVPDFQRLRQEDQLILLKNGFFEIWLARMSRLFNAVEGNILFADGSVVPRMELELVYGPDLMEMMFNFCVNFAQLGLNDTEIGLVTSIILSNPGHVMLLNAPAVEALRNKLMEAFQFQLTRNHPLEPDLFVHSLARLPALSQLSSAHNQQLDWFRQRWALLRVPPLFAEMYNLPRLDDADADIDCQVGQPSS